MVEIKTCPECGSTELNKFGTRWKTINGKRTKVRQYQCKVCGRITVNPIEEDK